MGRGRILIVEDSVEISDVLAAFLRAHEYDVECVYDGREGARRLKIGGYILVLMDLMLPYKSGEELICEFRERENTPVICLSAKSQMETRLEVLRMGADDYILKPFDLNEVLVRIEVVLRRSNASDKLADTKKDAQESITIRELTFQKSENRVLYHGEEIALTLKEMQLLALLMENPSKTFTKANLYESVWGDVYYYEDNTINVHISNLRSKLKKVTGQEYIETVWGIGYRMSK